MRYFVGVIGLTLSLLLHGPALAQSSTWLQVEAQPTLRAAQDRVQAYEGRFDDVSGFQMRTGWYAIVLGPYSEQEALRQLRDLRASARIPADSYLTDGASFTRRYWPVAGAVTAPQPVTPAPQTAPEPTQPGTETVAQARRGEAALTRTERDRIQEALKWEGFYDSTIDGAFGPGTRAAMAAYQQAIGFEPTGVLTTAQRTALVDGYAAALTRLGLETIDEAEAGIRIPMPSAMVTFSRYEPPFVHYDSIGDSGVRVLLISQPGDAAALSGLYEVMQTLEIVPLQGSRALEGSSFFLSGQNDTLHSYTYATLAEGSIKGFTLIWKPEDAALMNKVAQIMRQGLQPYGGHALDDRLGAGGQVSGLDLLAGLELRRPEKSRTGFFVDEAGTVLTTTEVLGQCDRITLAGDVEAEIAARDDALGLALLRPRVKLSPLGYATFQVGLPAVQSEVAAAGFSYGDILDQPVLTYGLLSELKGLDGEPNVNRLALAPMPGDAGAPVFDQSGAVLGLLLPKSQGQRQLPGDVSFAANVETIAGFLSEAGVQAAAADANERLDPVDLSARALDMTVLVSCWN